MSNLIFDWQVVNDIGVQLQFNYLDDYFLDAENEHTYSGHTIVDLRAEWRLDTRTAVSVKINNVLDELKGSLNEKHLLISLVSGVEIEFLRKGNLLS